MRVREGRRWRGVPGKLQEINLEATLQHSLSVLIKKMIIISIIIIMMHCELLAKVAQLETVAWVGGPPPLPLTSSRELLTCKASMCISAG